METRMCKKCCIEKTLDQFVKHSMVKGGYLYTCKSCNGVARRKRVFIPNDTSSTKTCPVCSRELSVDRFRIYTKSKTGRYWMCEECYQHHLALTNGDKNYFRKLRLKLVPEYRKEVNSLHTLSRQRRFIEYMWRAAKSRARKKGLDFNIDISDIVIPEICPILEVPFILGTKGNYSYTPSLDRIDNSKGYIKGNIMVISQKANSMKNNATWDEIHRFVKNIIRYSPNYTKKESIELQDKEPVS
jgi:hypothetical protein